MMKRGFTLAPLLLIWALSLTQASARELVDALGTRVTLPETPVRIVTLIPSLAELVADLLPGKLERVVGVSEYTDYPAALKRVKSIGPYDRFSLELVRSLKPDLVLGTLDGNSRDQIEHLREMKIPVVLVNSQRLEQVLESVDLVAQALGEPEAGKKIRQKLVQGLDEIKARATKRQRRKVLLQFGEEPLIVAGGKSFLTEAIALVGADNVYSESKDTYPRVTTEDAIRRDPEWILVLRLGEDVKPFKKMVSGWSGFTSMRAVREKKVRMLTADPLLRPSLRLLDGLRLLEQELYGAN